MKTLYIDVTLDDFTQTVEVYQYITNAILCNVKRTAKIATRKGMDIYRQIRMYVVAELQRLHYKANENTISEIVAYVNYAFEG